MTNLEIYKEFFKRKMKGEKPEILAGELKISKDKLWEIVREEKKKREAYDIGYSDAKKGLQNKYE